MHFDLTIPTAIARTVDSYVPIFTEEDENCVHKFYVNESKYYCVIVLCFRSIRIGNIQHGAISKQNQVLDMVRDILRSIPCAAFVRDWKFRLDWKAWLKGVPTWLHHPNRLAAWLSRPLQSSFSLLHFKSNGTITCFVISH